MNKEITQQRIIEFQDAIIEILEVSKEGDSKAQMFINSYKSTVQTLKQQLKDAE